MDILPLTNETFDSFLFKSHNLSKTLLSERFEIIDRKLYLWTKEDKEKRFTLIRKDERTILTSFGIYKYKRRYYFDNKDKKYVYLLDNQLGIPKNSRMSSELILKLLELASIMTYKEVGTHLSNEFELSKYTVWKTIKNSYVECCYDNNINRNGMKIHVQVDEKFIYFCRKKKRNEKVDEKDKKKYYTLTIFAGKELIGINKYRLLNKTVISSSDLSKLKKRVNEILVKRYKVSVDEEIFISGDLAKYIQNFGEYITVCSSKYVPDKFHVFQAIENELKKSPREEINQMKITKLNINDPKTQEIILKNLTLESVDSRKIFRLLAYKPQIFKTYLDNEYLGCSQEGQNSHVYAPRFGKYANRFNRETVEKLSLIREANAMGCTIILGSTTREPEEPIELININIDLDPKWRDVLDTSEMKYETKQMFDAIKYGNH